ncbi:hypothetical protein [Caulobacter segnis]
MIVAGALAAVVLGAVGVGLTVYVLRDADSEETADNKDDPLQIAGAKIALENRFPDAQLTFGQTFVHWDGEVPSVCGRVDIVEKDDSFDGEERYVFSEGGLTIEEVDGTDALEQKWSDVCE